MVHGFRFLRLCSPETPHPAFRILLPPVDSQRQHVIFQPVQLFSGKAAETAAQIPEYALIGITLHCHIQRRPDKFHKGIGQGGPLLVHKTGDPSGRKCSLGFLSVIGQVAGHHGKIPVSAALFSHQAPDGSRHVLHLHGRGFRRAERNSVLLSPPDLSPVPEQMALQKSQSRALCKAALLSRQNPAGIQYLRPGQRRRLRQSADHLPGHVEQSVGAVLPVQILSLIQCRRHINLPAEAQQLFQHMALGRGETRKAIQHRHAPPHQAGLSDHAAEQLRKLLRRRIFFRQVI